MIFIPGKWSLNNTSSEDLSTQEVHQLSDQSLTVVTLSWVCDEHTEHTEHGIPDAVHPGGESHSGPGMIEEQLV